LLPTATMARTEVGTVHEPSMYFAKEPALLALVAADPSGDRFAAAVDGGRPAAELELQTGRAVLDIGGYHGSNSLPTLATLQHLVVTRQIHYLERQMGSAKPKAAQPITRPAGVAAATRPFGVAHYPPVGKGTSALDILRAAERTQKPHSVVHPVSHPVRAPSVATQFLQWVGAHYPVVYSDPSDKLYDLWTPISHLPALHPAARTNSPASH
jgi:hypothetical protein